MPQSFAGQGYGAGMRIAEIVNTIPVKNRFALSSVEITHDGEGVVWAPNEVKHLPPDYANWFVRKSTLKMNRKGLPTVQALVILGVGKDESPLDEALCDGPREVIERDPNVPTMFDADGVGLRPVITTVDTTPGVDQREREVNDKETASAQAAVQIQREKTFDAVATAVEKSDVDDAALERAARLIASGKAKAAEAGVDAGE